MTTMATQIVMPGNWTWAKPTVPGWYWWRSGKQPSIPHRLVEVYVGLSDELYFIIPPGSPINIPKTGPYEDLWCGPISTPDAAIPRKPEEGQPLVCKWCGARIDRNCIQGAALHFECGSTRDSGGQWFNSHRCEAAYLKQQFEKLPALIARQGAAWPVVVNVLGKARAEQLWAAGGARLGFAPCPAPNNGETCGYCGAGLAGVSNKKVRQFNCGTFYQAVQSPLCIQRRQSP